MKNFLLADSSELMAVRLISASWVQKRLIPSFLHMFWVEFMKSFLLADSSEQMAVRLISVSWAKNVWFLPSNNDVRPVHEKFSSRRFQTHFILLSTKTFDSKFLHMFWVEFMKNFLRADSSEQMAVRLVSAF